MFNNLYELITSMPDEKTCRDYLIKERWDGHPVCPYCGYSERIYIIEGGKRFKCGSPACYKKFSVTVGTIFEASNIKLNKWLTAIYLVTAHKKGISSYQLGRDLGVSQKTSWFMLHRIREMMKNVSDSLLTGVVELDETYMGRKYGSQFKGVAPELTGGEFSAKPAHKLKGAVIGLAQRNGVVRVQAWDSRSVEAISTTVANNVDKDNTKLMTDQSLSYNKILQDYDRQSVNHGAREWVRGEVHTNNIENFWSVMKRGVYGIYHQISYKHLQAYCNEYSYRYNTRKIKDCDRFTLSLQNMERRLPYKVLIKK